MYEVQVLNFKQSASHAPQAPQLVVPQEVFSVARAQPAVSVSTTGVPAHVPLPLQVKVVVVLVREPVVAQVFA